MAKRSQRLKTQKQYKAQMRRLRGKVRFDYDLRKNLTRGQKSAISSALNQMPADQTSDFIQPKKRRGESGTAFAKRLNTIKRNSGQANSPFTGIFAKVPANATATIQNDALTVSVPSQNYSEIHKNINNRKIASDTERAAYLDKTLKRYENQGFTGVAFRMGTGRTIEFEIDEIELMDEMLSAWVAQYGKQFANNLFANVMNGIILTVRP